MPKTTKGSVHIRFEPPGLPAFSSLQFAVSAVTDDTYREEFLGDLVHDVREAFAVRALYLRLLGVPAASSD